MSGKPPINSLAEIFQDYKNPRESSPSELLYQNGHNDGIANIKPKSLHPTYLIGWTKARRFQFSLATGSFGVCDVEYQKLNSRSSLDGFWDGLNLADPMAAKVVGYQPNNREEQPILIETDRTMSEPDYKLGYEAGLRFLGGLVQSSPHLELAPLADGHGYQDLLSALALPSYDLKQETIKEYQKDPMQKNTTAQIFADSLNKIGIEKILAALSFSFTTGNDELENMVVPLPPQLPLAISTDTAISMYRRSTTPTISPLPSPKYPADEPEDESGWETLDTKPLSPKPITRTRPSLADAVSNQMPVTLVIPTVVKRKQSEDLPLSLLPKEYQTERPDDEIAWSQFPDMVCEPTSARLILPTYSQQLN